MLIGRNLRAKILKFLSPTEEETPTLLASVGLRNFDFCYILLSLEPVIISSSKASSNNPRLSSQPFAQHAHSLPTI